MSVLVVAKNLGPAPTVERVPVAELHRPLSYTEALAFWGASSISSWAAVVTWNNQDWDDLVNEAANDDRSRSVLVEALVNLAENSEELAIWYAGFPDDVPVVHSPGEFGRVLDEQLSSGELEPSVRLISNRALPQTPGLQT
jgi:hypothetical protein